MTDCILWDGPTMNRGYGRRYFPSTGHRTKDRYEQLAHRAAWEEANGPIPEGLTVHHRCENKLCVNVDHMALEDRRHHAGGRGHGKLTQHDADEIRKLLEDGVRGMDVAVRYAISRQQVTNIKKGRCWA